ncbi:DUF4123 domain-containing protein [Massilia sp. TN1-12]|uniref:DUF4123 domain-containing protein n=1 Tax=Massilia paldalensis TaxID=3377675 RepID=UPI00384E3139
MIDVVTRFQNRLQNGTALHLYALVDGFQYEQHTGRRLEHRAGINRPIFLGTEDEPLAHAGPWLVDTAKAPDQIQPLYELEQAFPSVSWLMTSIDLEGLSQLLQLKLDGELPDGRKVLVRFYDPRVLGNLFQTMSAEQKAAFFHLIDEWLFIYNGRRVWAGRSE